MACRDCRDYIDNICHRAACNGHLDCLIWARKGSSRKVLTLPKAIPWNEKTCAWAARGGHLLCLMWARKNGCPWNEWTCIQATRNGHKDIFKWIHKNGCPCDCIEKIVYISWDGRKKGEECAICLEELDETTVKFIKCTHHYHKECMDKMFEGIGKNKCSICERTK